jgi:two-component system response regulator
MATAQSSSVIIVAEDDANDLFLMQRLVAKAGIKIPLMSFRDGEEVVTFLRACTESGYKGTLPRVVFLDIKMPKVDGFEVLRWIRKQSTFKTLPVVILSGSDEPRDHRRAAELGANGFLVKHPRPEVFARLIAEY